MLDLAVDMEINPVAVGFKVRSEAVLPVRKQGKRCSWWIEIQGAACAEVRFRRTENDCS